MFSTGKISVNINDVLNRVTELDILSHYLGISNIPCFIQSPLRKDNKPSFGLYSKDGNKIYYTDLSTRDSGGTFDLLGKLWGYNFQEVIEKVYNDLIKFNTNNSNIKILSFSPQPKVNVHNSSILECKIREWKDYDLEYWSSYGIDLKWLKYAEVYPVSHKIITKDGKRHVFKTDKYAYAYVEHKEGKVSLKIYQPFNTAGYKWANKHDSSVISLWTQAMNANVNTDKVCICSSLKDALCLWANVGIPSLAIQGEGYKMSNTAINKLKERFKRVYILLDNDKPGLKMAKQLSEETGFINVVLPQFEEGKDISDLRKAKGKEVFLKIILSLFNN